MRPGLHARPRRRARLHAALLPHRAHTQQSWRRARPSAPQPRREARSPHAFAVHVAAAAVAAPDQVVQVPTRHVLVANGARVLLHSAPPPPKHIRTRSSVCAPVGAEGRRTFASRVALPPGPAAAWQAKRRGSCAHLVDGAACDGALLLDGPGAPPPGRRCGAVAGGGGGRRLLGERRALEHLVQFPVCGTRCARAPRVRAGATAGAQASKAWRRVAGARGPAQPVARRPLALPRWRPAAQLALPACLLSQASQAPPWASICRSEMLLTSRTRKAAWLTGERGRSRRGTKASKAWRRQAQTKGHVTHQLGRAQPKQHKASKTWRRQAQTKGRVAHR